MTDPKTPNKRKRKSEHPVPDTIKRARFFEAFDTRERGQSLREFVKEYPGRVPLSTADRWLCLRDEIGDTAYRTTRKRSHKLGRKSRVPKEQA